MTANFFRHTLKILHVYHTLTRNTELERLQTLVALNLTECYNRLQGRTHKNTWFEIKECKGEEAFGPHNNSLCHQAIAEEPALDYPSDGYAAIDGRQLTAGEPGSESPLGKHITADADVAERKQQREKKQRYGSTKIQGGACKNSASSCCFPEHQKQGVHCAKIAKRKAKPELTARRT